MKTETVKQFLQNGGSIEVVQPGKSGEKPGAANFRNKLRRSIERSVNYAISVRNSRRKWHRKICGLIDEMYMVEPGVYNSGLESKRGEYGKDRS